MCCRRTETSLRQEGSRSAWFDGYVDAPAATKEKLAGVNYLTGAMAAASTRKGGRVNNIAVGAVQALTLLDDLNDPEVQRGINAMGRLRQPEEIG